MSIFLIMLLQHAELSSPPQLNELPGEGPLEFRCNQMQIYSKPNHTICKDDVVVRRGPLLLCCTTFKGIADENWEWTEFVCLKNVRAQKNRETMWSQKAVYNVASSDLVLSGNAKILRGRSLMQGKQIFVNVNDDHARIHKPRGIIETMTNNNNNNNRQPEKAKTLPAWRQGALPDKCPLPPVPRTKL